MEFCNRCKINSAVVYNGFCEKCGKLKKSEIKTSKDYVVVFETNSKISDYLKIKVPGSYDLTN